MDVFQNLFLESSSSEEDGGDNISEDKKIAYEWYMNYSPSPDEDTPTESGSIHDTSFMILKYKADLFYFHREYGKASELFKKILGLVPKRNTCVTREIRDSLAHCYLRLGEGQQAVEEAEKLVLAPHEKDWSSWMLLAECHKMLEDYEAQVLALQSSASLQRCHSRFWIALSEGYKKLQSLSETASKSVRLNCCSNEESSMENLTTILVRTVQLFRPYFSWRAMEDNEMESIKPNHESYSEETTRGDCCEGRSGASADNADDYCSEHCVFSRTGFSQESCSYCTTISSNVCCFQGVEAVSNAEELPVPNLRLQLCFYHSPFVMLVRRFLSPEELIGMMRDLHHEDSNSRSGSDVSHRLLSCIFSMAECSSLVWARQLLHYSVRYSHSFPKEALKNELSKVEEKLGVCHTGTRSYVLKYFTKRSVFDEI